MVIEEKFQDEQHKLNIAQSSNLLDMIVFMFADTYHKELILDFKVHLQILVNL